MKNKTLYYAVDDSLTMIKTINVYQVMKGGLRKFCELECFKGFISNKEEIQNYLNDNGHEDEEFEFIKL